jgi:hypothetical protein
MSAATTMAGGRSDFASSEASLYANLALEQIYVASGSHHNAREAIAISSTTSGGNRVGLPTDFAYPLSMTLYAGSSSTNTVSRTTATHPLIQKDAAWADAQDQQVVGGLPEHYVLFGSWMELFPSPNSAYSLQLRYGTEAPILVASSETPALSPRFHQAWLYKTVELLHGARSDVEGEALARNRYVNYVSTLDTDRANRQQDRKSMSVNVVMGSRRVRRSE